MKRNTKCYNCEENATNIILDETLTEYVEACDDCYEEIFLNMANSGSDDFYEWAVEMFGKEKAMGLTTEIFGTTIEKETWDENGNVVKYDENDRVWMFTYGILKYPHNIKREGGTDIVENCTIDGHHIFLYNNSFPVTSMTGNADDKVYGTLFSIPRFYVLDTYDQIEGYNPMGNPKQNMYNRIDVDVTKPDGTVQKAQMYYANQRMFASEIHGGNYIPTGNFDDRHLAKSYGYGRRK